MIVIVVNQPIISYLLLSVWRTVTSFVKNSGVLSVNFVMSD